MFLVYFALAFPFPFLSYILFCERQCDALLIGVGISFQLNPRHCRQKALLPSTEGDAFSGLVYLDHICLHDDDDDNDDNELYLCV